MSLESKILSNKECLEYQANYRLLGEMIDNYLLNNFEDYDKTDLLKAIWSDGCDKVAEKIVDENDDLLIEKAIILVLDEDGIELTEEDDVLLDLVYITKPEIKTHLAFVLSEYEEKMKQEINWYRF